MDEAELIERFPTLFHMADVGAWPAIEEHGLLSVEALLDLYEVPEPQRTELLTTIRPEMVRLDAAGLPGAWLRDNKPLNEKKLASCLEGTDVAGFMRALNSRVFFWLDPRRVEQLFAAKAYRDRSHLVIGVDTEKLIERHGDRVALTAINTGSTVYDPKPRGPHSFMRVADYPYDDRRRIRGWREAIAELTVEHAVPDIADLVVSREVRKAGTPAQ